MCPWGSWEPDCIISQPCSPNKSCFTQICMAQPPQKPLEIGACLLWDCRRAVDHHPKDEAPGMNPFDAKSAASLCRSSILTAISASTSSESVTFGTRRSSSP
jgi:hypothetical protein